MGRSWVPGRQTAVVDQPIVVFAIGMRINELWAVHRWLRPTIDTARMWWYLQRHGTTGYRSGYLFIYSRGVGMIQYWDDFDALEAFSHDRTQPHRAAWQRLAALTKTSGTFGYWHETYSITPGQAECIYGSMPAFGMAAAMRASAVEAASDNARIRLG